MGLAYVIMVAIPRWPLFLLPILCAGAGFVLCHSTFQTRATETFPASRGTAVALFAFSLFLGNGLGASVVGVAIDRPATSPTLLAAGLLLWGFALAAAYFLFARADLRDVTPKARGRIAAATRRPAHSVPAEPHGRPDAWMRGRVCRLPVTSSGSSICRSERQENNW